MNSKNKTKRNFKRKLKRLNYDYKYGWLGGAWYDLFGKTRSLRLRHKDGKTLGFNTDSFGTLSSDKFRAKRYHLTSNYGKDHWLDSGKNKLDTLFKWDGNRDDDTKGLGNLFKTLNLATFDRGYSGYDRDDLYFDLYRYSLLDRLKLLTRALKRKYKKK
jgi:hypothetical protein